MKARKIFAEGYVRPAVSGVALPPSVADKMLAALQVQAMDIANGHREEGRDRCRLGQSRPRLSKPNSPAIFTMARGSLFRHPQTRITMSVASRHPCLLPLPYPAAWC